MITILQALKCSNDNWLPKSGLSLTCMDKRLKYKGRECCIGRAAREHAHCRIHFTNGGWEGHSLPSSFLWSSWQCQQNATDRRMDTGIVTLRGDTAKLLSMCDAHSWSFHRVFSFPWQVIFTYVSYILP